MIRKVSGTLVALTDDRAELLIDAFQYEVLIPDFVRRHLGTSVGHSITLHTIYYFEGNPAQGRMTPRLIGFSSDVEREFFEMFCSVDGVGVRKALRAMVRPVRDVAVMIEEQDAKGLSALPGVGPATAERIIAKLRRKMSKFALMVTQADADGGEMERDVVQDSFEALRALGHSESDARRLIDSALASKKKFKDVESLLQSVYQSFSAHS